MEAPLCICIKYDCLSQGKLNAKISNQRHSCFCVSTCQGPQNLYWQAIYNDCFLMQQVMLGSVESLKGYYLIAK